MHVARIALKRRFPVHVTLRLKAGLPSLRVRSTHDALLDALVAGSNRWGLRVLHYSAQTNHVHLICEADEELALARGMKGLCVRIARALNAEWMRRGTVFEDRYHARILKTPLEVRNALVYVLLNARHHGQRLPGGIDRCSSSAWFDGWTTTQDGGAASAPRSPFPKATTWLLTCGWLHHGRIDPETDLDR